MIAPQHEPNPLALVSEPRRDTLQTQLSDRLDHSQQWWLLDLVGLVVKNALLLRHLPAQW